MLFTTAIRVTNITLTENANNRNNHVIMIFPPLNVFAVFNARRTVFTFITNVSIYLNVSNRSVTFTGMSKPMAILIYILYRIAY